MKKRLLFDLIALLIIAGYIWRRVKELSNGGKLENTWSFVVINGHLLLGMKINGFGSKMLISVLPCQSLKDLRDYH